MDDLAILKLNLQESKFPYFSDEELQSLLTLHQGVWTASYYGCVMKAQENNQISLPGGLSIPSNSEYWMKLAAQYEPKMHKEQLELEAENKVSSSGYKTSMCRVDGQ